jgi:predicted XRE-type DNA-binding protein
MKPYVEVKNLKELCKALGLPQSHAPKVEMRRDLVIGIKEVIKKKALTQVQAAKKADVGRTVITAIVNGNIAKISTDKLIDVATSLGLKLHLEVAA